MTNTKQNHTKEHVKNVVKTALSTKTERHARISSSLVSTCPTSHSTTTQNQFNRFQNVDSFPWVPTHFAIHFSINYLLLSSTYFRTKILLTFSTTEVNAVAK